MPDRDLQAILNSGEITNIFIGGTTSDDKVVILSDLTGANVDFDKTGTSLTSTTVQAALAELANVGYAHMILSTPYTSGQTFGTTPAKISLFDTIHHDVNGAVTPVVDTSESVPNHSFTCDKAGTYDISGTVNAEFSSSDAISMQMYVNGSPVGYVIELQGRGAGKPVSFTYDDKIDANVNDVIEVYAFSDAASTSVLVTSASMTLERKAIS
jgi:hypothetical protein